VIGSHRIQRIMLAVVFVVLAPLSLFAQESPQSSRYTISLANAAKHLISIKIELPAGLAKRNLQLPVWYALYQIRDFSQYINWVHSSTPIKKIDKSEWRIAGAENGATIEYEIFADDAGPFGAQLNSHHAFFNLAEILMYPTDDRDSPMQIHFINVPTDWRVGTTLRPSGDGFAAHNYDELADSPVEISAFDETDFDQDGGHYRVIVDAAHGDYDTSKIMAMLQDVVHAEVSWMADRPFDTYLFIYHFPRDSEGGGMEHAYSTAIDLRQSMMQSDPHALQEISAHEFFHLWNVKRIRPQSLEPPDYTKENYTDALWFSEGFTSTVENYMLLRAKLLDKREYFAHLAAEIEDLENRPAHLTQSAEESSIDTWLEKYSYYRRPDRSVSYYEKGELLGVMLDLDIRSLTGGNRSLRDMFQWMNVNYAQKSVAFADSEGVRQAAETITRSNLAPFFDKYVSGTDEIPWNVFFKTVGLNLITEKAELPDVGFTASRNFDSPLTVNSVDENSAAQIAGLSNGDVILEVNGEPPGIDFASTMKGVRPGENLTLRTRNGKGERELSWKVNTRQELEFRITEQDNLTPQQKTRRAAWLKAESEQP